MTTNSPVRLPRDVRYLLSAVLAVTGLLAGCSSGSNGPAVANLGSATNSASQGDTGSGSGDPLKYSKCMRAHGIADFPDPGPNGQLQLRAGPGSDLNPDSPQFQAAQRACEKYRPAPSAEQQQQAYQAMLKFSNCMRAHGIADFPDPDPDGRMTIKAGQGSDLNPNSPQFQAAQRACQKYMPGGKGGIGGATDEGNG